MWVYLYPSNTETELKNAYIGEYPPKLVLVLHATWWSRSPSSWKISEDSAWATIVWDTVVIDWITYTFTANSWKRIVARQIPWWQYDWEGKKQAYVVNRVAN